MAGPTRITRPLLDVLETLIRAFDEDTEVHGWAIMRATKLAGPTVYGVLDRLEDAEWITGHWEDRHPETNKPRRRFYRLTPTGLSSAHNLLAAHRPQQQRSAIQPVPGLVLPAWVVSLLAPDGR